MPGTKGNSPQPSALCMHPNQPPDACWMTLRCLRQTRSPPILPSGTWWDAQEWGQAAGRLNAAGLAGGRFLLERTLLALRSSRENRWAIGTKTRLCCPHWRCGPRCSGRAGSRGFHALRLLHVQLRELFFGSGSSESLATGWLSGYFQRRPGRACTGCRRGCALERLMVGLWRGLGAPL